MVIFALKNIPNKGEKYSSLMKDQEKKTSIKK